MALEASPGRRATGRGRARRLTPDPDLPAADYAVLAALPAAPTRTGYAGAAAGAMAAASAAVAAGAGPAGIGQIASTAGQVAAATVLAAGRALGFPAGHAAGAVAHVTSVLTLLDAAAVAIGVPAAWAVMTAVLLRSAARERSARRRAGFRPRRVITRAMRNHAGRFVNPAGLDDDLARLLESVQQAVDVIRSSHAAAAGILREDHVESLRALEYRIGTDLHLVNSLRNW